MILSFLRITSALLAVTVLLSMLALPVRGTGAEEMEIIVREDRQLLQQAARNAVAGLGAAACMAVIFRIVWKQKEP